MLSCYKVMQMYAKGSINLPVDNILHGKRTDTFLMMIGDVDGSMRRFRFIKMGPFLRI